MKSDVSDAICWMPAVSTETDFNALFMASRPTRPASSYVLTITVPWLEADGGRAADDTDLSQKDIAVHNAHQDADEGPFARASYCCRLYASSRTCRQSDKGSATINRLVSPPG